MKFIINFWCCNKLIIGNKKRDQLTLQQTMYLFVSFIRPTLMMIGLLPLFMNSYSAFIIGIAAIDFMVWSLARFRQRFYHSQYIFMMIAEMILILAIGNKSVYAILPYLFVTNVAFALVICKGALQLIIPFVEIAIGFIILSIDQSLVIRNIDFEVFPYIAMTAITSIVSIFFIYSIHAERVRSDLIKKIEVLKYLTYYDDLTSIYNKGYIHMMLKELFEESRERNMNDVSIILIDLDNFKIVNETYGHRNGDHVIRSVTSCIQRSIRRSDIFGRLSGEQFMIIIPSSGLTQARILGEKLRAKVDALEYLIGENKGYFKVTASFGITIMREHDKSERDVIHRAEKLLYLSKKQGKNRTNFG